MNPFKLFIIGFKMPFSSQISPFYYSVAMLCSAKKLAFENKITIFRYNENILNEFK